MRTTGKTIAAMAISVLLISFGGTAAFADDEDAPSVVQGDPSDLLSPVCTDEQVQAGYCAPFLALPGQEPVVEAVRQLALSGQGEAAELFAETAADAYPSLEGDIEAMLADPEPSTLPNQAAARPPVDGVIYGSYFWSFDDFVVYGYCNPSGCTSYGSLSLQVNYSIVDYPVVTLDGYFGVGSGPAIKPDLVTCKIFQELWPFDQPVHEWSSCPDAQSPSYVSGRTIFPSNWVQSANVGDQFHLEYLMNFKVLGDASNSTVGGLFNSHTYKIAFGAGNTGFIPA